MNVDLPTLRLPMDGSWQTDALCAQKVQAGLAERDWWFPTTRKWDDPRHVAAVAICEVCPVREPCLEWAIALPETHGIWGATRPNQRIRTGNTRRRQCRICGEIFDVTGNGRAKLCSAECARIQKNEQTRRSNLGRPPREPAR